MPTIGERSPHDCPDCGQPMYWSDAAVRRQQQPARAGDIVSATEYFAAYRCAEGHVSRPCPLCGSYETAAWRDPDNLHYHLICGSCGNDSAVNA